MKFGLQIKADLENLTNLRPVGQDFRWYLKLKCSNCGDETGEFVYVTEDDTTEVKGGRGEAHLVIKCKFCQRQNSLDILPATVGSYMAADSGKLKTIIQFDCRGVEPTAFEPRKGWSAEGAETGTKFTEIDLLDLDWSEYDEKAKETVGVYSLESAFKVMK